MKVRKLPVDPGPAAWNEILPAATRKPELEGAITADWLVIGGGFAGLSAARRLRQLQPEATIVLLEAKTIAHGPAGRNSGFMIDLPHDISSEDYGGGLDEDKTQIELNRLAIAFARDAAQEYEMSDEAARPSGKINGAATEKGLSHNNNYAAHLKKLSEQYELLDAQAMNRLTGSHYYLGGLYTPGTLMLQPALYIRSLAQGLERSGVRIAENSPVTALEQEGGNWKAFTPKGSVSANKAILAVNGHAQSFGYFKGQLMHVFTYASMTTAMSAEEIKELGGEANWGITPADPMGTTVRRISGTGGDRIVIRNRFTCNPGMEVSEARIAGVAQDHNRSFKKRFPELKDLKMEYRWAGRLCLSRNNAPAFGEVAQGLFSACCQNGLGTAKGTLAGMAAAEAGCDVQSRIRTELENAPQPQALPPEPLTWIGANSYMMWKEFRAGAEL